MAGSLSPSALALLAAASQPSASPGLLSGVASPPVLAAAVAARSSPALAALQLAAALNSNRNTPATTPSATPGVSTSGEQFGALAAAGLSQLAAAAVAAAQSPPVWNGTNNSNSSAASNWLYGPNGTPNPLANPLGGGIGSPALAAGASPSLLARLSPAITSLMAAQNNQSSFLLNNYGNNHHQHHQSGHGEVPSPSSNASSVVSGANTNISSTGGGDGNQSLASEVMLLRAAMVQQQQQNNQLLGSVIDAAQQAIASAQSQQTPTNAPVTPKAKMAMPTPTSRPRHDASMFGTAHIAGQKRPLHHQQTRPQDMGMPMMHGMAAYHPAGHSPAHSAFRQMPHQQQPMPLHHQQPQHIHHQRPKTPPNEPHIKKPLNAFMLFMKEQRAQVIAECTLKESAAINQILGQRWHNLSREEQARYYDMAKAEKEKHAQMYPNWSARENYASHAKKKRRKMKNAYHSMMPGMMMGPDGGALKDPRDAALKKCRARYGIDQMDKWCKPCRRKKKCARYYNLPGGEDDDGVDGKSTSSSHHNMGGAPGMAGIVPGMNTTPVISGGHHPHQFMHSGGPVEDDWGSDDGSSVGDSDEDEEQLNAFHLVTESSSGNSTPSPTPPAMAPLSPTSSIHSSASHHHLNHPLHHQNLPTQVPFNPAAMQFHPSMIPPNLMQQQMATSQQLQLSTSGMSQQQLEQKPPPVGTAPHTPPSSTSTNTGQQLCSPNSQTSNAGLAYRPLLPAN